MEALAYRRHVGATLGDIRAVVGIREKTKRPLKDTLAVLRQLADDGTVAKVARKWFLRPTRAPKMGIEALKPRWQSEDSLILLALLLSGRERPEARLEDIVAAADYIDHAIPSREEMHGALNRLLAGRLIQRKRDAFSATDTAVELLTKVASVGRSVQDQLDALRRIMDCPCCGVTLKEVRWRMDLDEQTFEDAVTAYLGRAK